MVSLPRLARTGQRRGPSPGRALLGSILLAACAGGEADERRVSQVPGRAGESTAQRLHRHGVNCMDELERDACAIDYFEQLVALDAADRALMGDGIFRLVKLYKKQGRDDEVQALLRRYWSLGMARGSSELVPYAARFLPAEMSVMLSVSPARLSASSMWRALPPEVHDIMFTCDDARREALDAERKARREAARERGDQIALESPGRRQGKESQEQKKTDEGAEPKKAQDEADADRPDPVSDHMCELAAALGHDDMRAWRRFTTAADHWDPRVSALIVELDGLDGILERAVAAGTLVPVEDRRWRLPTVEYEGASLELVRLDSDELVMATPEIATGLLTALDARDERLHPDMRALLDATPDDVVFFTAMTRPALVWGIKQAGELAAAVMPQPRGMVISAVAYDYAGVFVRMHTPDRLKGAMLVGLVRLFMQGQARDAAEAGREGQYELLNDMDLSQTEAGDILFSSVLGPGQVERLFFE